MLEKEAAKKPSAPAANTASKTTPSQAKDAPAKRKPRKLNKDPTPTSTAPTPSLSNEAVELEALKSRVRGLEAKVEDLYKSTPPPTTTRSPRRRGKGRKNSSATTTATLGTLDKERQSTPQVTELDDEEEADEELERLESELEVARQDLQQYRPRTRRATSNDTEHVEEIPRDAPGVSTSSSDRQVTLSGSYRIPLPATLNPADVKTIQSGVSAAQNVARSFLDQRRANQALRSAAADAPPPPSSSSSQQQQQQPAREKKPRRPAAATQDSGTELSTQLDAGKQSWGEWIGGYSMAISRAVKTIEHEAAMEAGAKSERPSAASRTSTNKAVPKAGGAKKKKERPVPKTTLSGEQVQGLMS